MGDPVRPADAPPLPVEYDDTRIQIAPDLYYASGVGVVTGAALQINDASDGSSYSTALDVTINPENGAWTVGPMFRMGGVGLGLMAGSNGVMPQIGIGGLSIVPNAGVCSGFLCAGAGGLDLIAPEAMLLISGIKSLAVAFSMDKEDLPALPLAIVTEVVGDLIPVRQIQDTLSTIGVPLGRGPKARRITTLEDMIRYRREIDGLIASNARVDAIARIEEALKIQQDPYAEAELRDLLDLAHYEQNAKGMPLGSAIEKNIRQSVDAVDAFLAKYAAWLKDGSGPAPGEAEIQAFMARSLYLARKLNFTSERKAQKTKVVVKIRTSTPFQMRDPELAVRYAETMTSVFQAVGNTASGLAAFVRAETERRSGALLAAAGGKALEADRALPAEARRSWHISWVQSMGLLYEQGFYHRRLAHLRFIVTKKAKGEQQEALLARMAKLAYPEMRAFREGVMELASCSVLPPDRYEKIRPGIEALRAAEELSSVEFPDEMGDGSLLFDKERAKAYMRRAQIVDAFYKYAALMRILIDTPRGSSPEATILWNLAIAARNRITRVMEHSKAEVRREWWDYWQGPMGHWKDVTTSRLGDVEDEIEDFPYEELFQIKKRVMADPALAPQLEDLITRYNALTVDMLADIRKVIGRSRKFPLGGFKMLKALYAQEEEDSKAITGYYRRWRGELLPAYAELKAKLIEAKLGDDKKVKEFFKKAEEQFGLTEKYLQRAMANYERMNARRVGAFFLNFYMDQLRIEPITPQSERFSF